MKWLMTRMSVRSYDVLRVRRAREALGWSQGRLAEEAGLSFRVIELLEQRGEFTLKLVQADV
jgi:ribosome-binding protein aMBF1 (putative translation factor)